MTGVYKLVLMKLLKLFYIFKYNFNNLKLLKLYLKYKIKNFIFLYKTLKKKLNRQINVNVLFFFILQKLNILNKKIYNKYSIFKFSKYLYIFFKKYKLNFILYSRMKQMLK